VALTDDRPCGLAFGQGPASPPWNRQQRDCTLYNDVRPHSSLGYLTLAAFKAKHLLNNAPRSVVRTDDLL
jgi:hypothetical protein